MALQIWGQPIHPLLPSLMVLCSVVYGASACGGHLHSRVFGGLKIHRMALLMTVTPTAGSWAMRDVAQMTWALGVLEQPEPAFIAACQHAAGRRMAQASVVDLINLMWGYARLGAPLSGPCMQMHTVSQSLSS